MGYIGSITIVLIKLHKIKLDTLCGQSRETEKGLLRAWGGERAGLAELL